MEPSAPPDKPQRWARVLPDNERSYPASYRGQWFRIVERNDPDVPIEPDYIWLGLAQLLGAVRTIAKPFTFDDMFKAVNEELST